MFFYCVIQEEKILMQDLKKKQGVGMRYLVSAGLLTLHVLSISAGDTNNIGVLYQEIGHKLAEVKKTNPTHATKISSIFDSLDRLYQVASNAVKKDAEMQQELETRTLESTVLQKELLTAKQESENLKQMLDEAQIKIKKLEKEQATLAALNAKKQHSINMASNNTTTQSEMHQTYNSYKKYAQGTADYGQNTEMSPQNLNLTSTSEPSSPR